MTVWSESIQMGNRKKIKLTLTARITIIWVRKYSFFFWLEVERWGTLGGWGVLIVGGC